MAIINKGIIGGLVGRLGCVYARSRWGKCIVSIKPTKSVINNNFNIRFYNNLSSLLNVLWVYSYVFQASKLMGYRSDLLLLKSRFYVFNLNGFDSNYKYNCKFLFNFNNSINDRPVFEWYYDYVNLGIVVTSTNVFSYIPMNIPFRLLLTGYRSNAVFTYIYNKPNFFSSSSFFMPCTVLQLRTFKYFSISANSPTVYDGREGCIFTIPKNF